MELKYVRHSLVGFILWPSTGLLLHAHVGQLLGAQCKGRIVSAGFAKLHGGKVRCHGRSESLDIASRLDDSKALAEQLGLKAD